MHERTVQLLIDQMGDVQAQHSGLSLVLAPTGRLHVQGKLGFCIEHDGRQVEDVYAVELHVPEDYPDSPPTVYETEGKVPREFEHFMKAGNFCLGAPVEVRRRFARHKTLIGFINEQVIPYLFSYSYKREHGQLPFGERKHGYAGLIDYYQEHFAVGLVFALKLVKYLADDAAPPLAPCPCGSGRPLCNCHGPRLDELRAHCRPEWFRYELQGMIAVARQRGIPLPEQEVMPSRTWRNREKRRRKTVRRQRQQPR